MKWRGFGTESPSGLHCTNRYWSSNRPMDRSSNRLCIGSIMNLKSGLPLVGLNHTSESVIPQHAIIHTCMHVHSNTPTHIIKETNTHKHNSQACTHAHVNHARASTCLHTPTHSRARMHQFHTQVWRTKNYY